MITLKKRERLSAVDLNGLATAAPPCITILLPLPDPFGLRAQLKNTLRSAKEQLKGSDMDSGPIGTLLQPIEELVPSIEAEGAWEKGLVVLRSPAVFHRYWLRQIPTETVAVRDQFLIGPILVLFGNATPFYLLALSQKQVHLYRCTGDSSDRVRPPDNVPTNLNAWLHTRKPDHLLDNRAAAGPSVGSMRGVTFGTSTDRESQDEVLRHFFKEIDKGIHSVLTERDLPLVLAGVEYEVALYRRVNTYPRLIEEAVLGSLYSLQDELFERAREIVRRHEPDSLRSALLRLDGLRGSVRASFDHSQIHETAQDGRIEDLFISRTAIRGDDTRSNSAAIQTLLHSGRVFVLNPDQMPDGAALAAVLRY
jgi:Bacterial archaeo-eukaryotic release factor family 3